MSKEKGINLEYLIAKDNFDVAGEASSNIKRVLTQVGVDPKIIRRASIATYEAEINIVIHSLGGKVVLKVLEDRIKIIAQDNGPGIADTELAMREGYSTATDKIRELGFGAGMGLPNMKRNSDEFIIFSELGKGTSIEMTIFV